MKTLNKDIDFEGFFKWSEFDCKGEPGSGYNMDSDFLRKLVRIRKKANTPFILNSAYRSKRYNDYLASLRLPNGRPIYRVAKNSYHTKGKAVDIRCTNSTIRGRIIAAAIEEGIGGIGIMKTAIHLDDRPRTGDFPLIFLYDY